MSGRSFSRTSLGAWLLALILAIPAYASPSLTRITTERSGWSLGLGFLSYGWPYRDVTRFSRFVPLVDAQGDGFYVHGLQAGWMFAKHRHWRMALVLTPELLHLNPSYGPYAKGLQTRLATLMGGIRFGYIRPLYAVHLAVLHDLLGRSKGTTLRLSAGPRWAHGGWHLSTRFGLNWVSAQTVNYYFGVPLGQQTSGRPVYEPSGGAIEADGAVVIARSLGSHFEAIASFQETWYGNAISASPLVDRSTAWSGLIGLEFRFR